MDPLSCVEFLKARKSLHPVRWVEINSKLKTEKDIPFMSLLTFNISERYKNYLSLIFLIIYILIRFEKFYPGNFIPLSRKRDT